MSDDERTDSLQQRTEAQPGAFFRSMVVVGGSIAMGCGGMVGDGSAGTDGAWDGSGGAGAASGGLHAGATTGSGDLPGSGATGSGATGSGATGSGGDGTGGAMVEPVEPGPFDCPPAQWSCEQESFECHYPHLAYRLPQDCSCDESRPAGISDCPGGTRLSCHAAQFNAEGIPLTERVLFACECMPIDEHCPNVCRDLDAQTDFARCDVEPILDLKQIVCGCELPVLK